MKTKALPIILPLKPTRFLALTRLFFFPYHSTKSVLQSLRLLWPQAGANIDLSQKWLFFSLPKRLKCLRD